MAEWAHLDLNISFLVFISMPQPVKQGIYLLFSKRRNAVSCLVCLLIHWYRLSVPQLLLVLHAEVHSVSSAKLFCRKSTVHGSQTFLPKFRESGLLFLQKPV